MKNSMVLLDVDRSGSISDLQVAEFVKTCQDIRTAAERKQRWLSFNHKVLEKQGFQKCRFYNKKNEKRFKLSQIQPLFKVVFSDGK